MTASLPSTGRVGRIGSGACGALAALATALLLTGGLLTSPTSSAQTKTCGTPGNPTACPPAAPVVTPWYYWMGGTYGMGSGPYASTDSLAAQWVITQATPPNGNWCTAPYTGYDSQSGDAYWSGIHYYFGAYARFAVTGYTNDPTPCQQHFQGTSDLQAQRNPSCPVGMTVTYSAGPPIVGPYCTGPGPDVFKSVGCPTCSAAGGNSGGADSGAAKGSKGDPTDITSGNLYVTETDYSGGGSNPLRFTRTYNSLTAFRAPKGTFLYGQQVIGVGWSATYFQSLYVTSVSDSTTTYTTVYANRPDGRILRFNLYSGAYVPDADVADVLTKSGTTYQYQTADDTIETYNAAGQLLSIAPRGKAPVTISYDALTGFVPAVVSDAFGHYLTFTYTTGVTGLPSLQSIKDPSGNLVSFFYDSNNNLTSVGYPDSTSRVYTYGGGGAYQPGTLNQLTDEASVAYVTWTYGGSGLYVQASANAGGVNSYSFTYNIGSTVVTDPLGTNRTYTLNQIQNVNRVSATSGLCPGCGEDASRSFDPNGNVTLRTDFNGNQTSYGYDQDRNLETTRTEAYGTSLARAITTQWNTTWRQPQLITEPNRTTAFTYDGLGNRLTKTVTDTTVTPHVTRVWTYTYDSYGRMLTADGPRTDVVDKTTYAYYTCTTGTQCGELQTVTDAVGNITTYNTYNAHGQPLTITDPNGTVTTLTYDSRLRVKSRQVGTETTGFSYYPTGLLQTVTLPDSSTITYTYDTAHRLYLITDGAGNYIKYVVDNMGNRTSESAYDPANTLSRTHTRVINALNQLYQDVGAAGTPAVTTTYGYDANGNQNSIAAPLSRTTGNQYDALNRLSQITDPNTGTTKYQYDGNDNVLTVTDPKSIVTTYTYNGFGDVATSVIADLGTGTASNTYDSGGNVATATDQRGAISTFTYDALNRVKTAAYKKGTVTDQTITYTYDAGTNGKGHLTGASDANHSMTWGYDALGRVTSKGQTVGGVVRTVGYAYTNADLTTLTTPSGQSVLYSYSNNQVTGITINGTTLLSGVTYEPLGQARGWTWGNATTEIRLHNTDGNASQISGPESWSYGYDNAFRITSASDASNSALSWTYGYDVLDRVTSASRTGTTQGFTYDADGSRKTETGTVSGTYSVPTGNNRLNSITGTPARTYTFDQDGEELTYANVTLTFNDRDRMASAAVSGVTTSYVYNALGQRIQKSGGPAGTVIFAYDEGGHLLGEYTSAGVLVEETVWLGDIPVATIRPGTPAVVYYVHADHLNAPRTVTQSITSGQIVWRWDTDPFGSIAPNQNPNGLGTFAYNLRFPGQYADIETGLYYNYYRDYDPQTGRYIESDPIGLTGGVNTYAYVGSDPVNLYDQDGLLSKAVANCVCMFMKASGYQSSLAYAAANARRKNPGPWNDPVLRPCENYLYAYAAVADYGDPKSLVVSGVWFHEEVLKSLPFVKTTPKSQEAKEAGYEGAADGAAHKDWKKQCEGCGR